MLKIKKEIAIELYKKVQEVAKIFSNPDRDKNYNNEVFEFEQIRPLSDFSAAVVFRKSSGKKAVAFFYYINSGYGMWKYFFPSDSHILGMEHFGQLKQQIEEFNFDKNGN